MDPPQIFGLLLAIFLIVSIMIGMNDKLHDSGIGEVVTGVIVTTMGVIVALGGALAVYGLGYVVIGKLLGW
jgi:hypothetical protein